MDTMDAYEQDKSPDDWCLGCNKRIDDCGCPYCFVTNEHVDECDCPDCLEWRITTHKTEIGA